MKRFFLLIFIALAIPPSCSGPIETDPLEEGFKKIDRAQYDEAIEHFQNLNDLQPSPTVKIAWASAFAGRAGVKIVNYWNFIKAMRGPPITEEIAEQSEFYIQNKKALRDLWPFLEEQNQKDLDQLFKILAGLDAYKQRLESIPYSNRPGDLKQGAKILFKVATQGGRLYRAALNTVIFRSSLADGFDLWSSIKNHYRDALHSPETFFKALCTPATNDLMIWIKEQLYWPREIALDVAIAFPTQKPEIMNFDESMLKIQSQVPDLQKRLVPAACRQGFP